MARTLSHVLCTDAIEPRPRSARHRRATERQAGAIELATAPAIGDATCQQLARRVAILDALEGWSLPVWQRAGRNCPDAGRHGAARRLAPMLLMLRLVMRDSQRRFAGTTTTTRTRCSVARSGKVGAST
jgi:hypothetical protein